MKPTKVEFTAWITKYALTTGIVRSKVDCDNRYPSMVVQRGDNGLLDFHGEGKDWHKTREGAIDRAEKMRKAKIESLKKQIAKLEKLRFE